MKDIFMLNFIQSKYNVCRRGIALACLMLTASLAFGQLSGSYNVGSGGDYTTITAALSDYNSMALTGPVTFVLTDAAYTAETFPLIINNNADASAANTLTIKPGAGVTVTISDAAAASAAVFKLLDAHFVTIDGVNAGGSSLTVTNTNTGAAAAIWLASTSGTGPGCNNIILQNMNINGSDYTLEQNWGIIAGSDDVLPSTTPGMDNDDITIQGNTILNCGYGIYAEGNDISSAGGLDNWTISNNIVGPASAGASAIGYEGIHLGSALNAAITGNTVQHVGFDGGAFMPAVGISINNNVTGATVSQNNINNVSSDSYTSSDNSNTGLYLGYNVTNVTVDKNTVTGIANTSLNGYGVRGMIVSTDNSASGITLSNNMISDIWCYTDENIIYGPVGIDIYGGTGGVNVYFNTVYLFGAHEGLTTYSSMAAALYLSTYETGIDVRDNILVNAYDNTTSSTDRSYAIYADYDASTFSEIDYNDYYVYAPTGVLAGIDYTDVTTLPDLITSFGGNTHSINAQPAFVAPLDLHLQVSGANAPLVAGEAISGITTDIDGTTRAATPVMGAHEVTLPSCTTVAAGDAVPDVASLCASGATTIHLPTSTAGLGITYQWQSSADSITFAPISGATTISYTTPVITATTYYRAILTCTFSGATDSAGVKITVHPLPSIAVTPDGGSICTGTDLSMTASGADTYTWAPATGLSATAGTTVSAAPPITTTYLVTGTDVFGCQGTHASTVSVIFTPATTVSPATAEICSGNGQLLTASANITGPGIPLTQNFAAGLAGWTVDNTGTTSTYPNVTWTVHGDGYENEIGVFHSLDNSDFILTNSDTAGADETVHTRLISPSFSLADYTDATLTFDHVFRSYPFGDISATVDVSTDGGTTWNTVYDYVVDGETLGDYDAFVPASFDLSSYAGQADVKLKFEYHSVYGYYWAMDNIVVSGTINAPVTDVVWTPTTGLYTDAALTIPYTGTAATEVYAAPVAATAPVVVTYTATATNGICNSAGTTTVTVNPVADAGTISGASTVCPGVSVTLTNTATGGAWTSSTSNATVNTSGVVTGVTAGTAIISYTVTGICGTDVATKIITVNPAPNAGTITGASSVCVSSEITLSDAVAGGTWSSSNANATITTSGVVTGVTAGTAVISYTTVNVCGPAIATHIITINALPVAGTISGSSALCVGSSATLTDGVSGGTWSASNTNATVSAAGVVTGAIAGTVTITYTITNVCGSAITTKILTVNALPTIYTVTGGGTYCEGGSGVNIGLSASQTGVAYQLYNGGTTIGTPVTGTGSAISFGMQTAAGTYTVRATNTTTGCTRNMTGSATVIINPTTPPTVSIATSTMSDTICAATAVTFTAIPVNGGATPSYIWTVNGSTVSGAGSYSYIPANGDVVSVQITSSSCALTDTSSSSVTITVTGVVMPAVSVITSTGTDSACAGLTVTFTAIPANGGSDPSFRWTKNGINVATGPTFSYVPVEGDVLYVMLNSSSPCRLEDSVYSSTITMHTRPLSTPVVSLTAHPGFTIAPGATDTIRAVVVNAGATPAYQWKINGVAVPGATNAVFISNSFADGDIVSCYVTSSGLCSGLTSYSAATIHISAVGIQDINTGISDVRIMPNPNKGAFTIKGSLATTEDVATTLEIVDMLGQVIYSNKVTAINGQLNEQVTLSNTLANGMYILNVQSASGRSVFHFILEH